MGKIMDFLKKIGVVKVGKAAAEQGELENTIESAENNTNIDNE